MPYHIELEFNQEVKKIMAMAVCQLKLILFLLKNWTLLTKYTASSRKYTSNKQLVN